MRIFLVVVILTPKLATAVRIPDVLRLAAFAGDSTSGGNPAGVVIGAEMPDVPTMQAIAAEVGYSETVFAALESPSHWRVRYFAPASEVSFCGHATIALGAALALEHGDGTFDLRLNDFDITVEGRRDDAAGLITAALQSPPTSSETASGTLAHNALALFGLSVEQLDQRIPISVASAGSSHLVIALDAHSDLTAMSYELDEGKRLMDEHGLTTIALLHAERNNRFCVRCAFASGGVHEDPATGSAAAALGGLLRDLGWPHAGRVEVTQGVDMGMPSKLVVEIGKAVGESVRVSGLVRRI